MYLKTAQILLQALKYDPVPTPLVHWEGVTLEMNQQEPGLQSTLEFLGSEPFLCVVIRIDKPDLSIGFDHKIWVVSWKTRYQQICGTECQSMPCQNKYRKSMRIKAAGLMDNGWLLPTSPEERAIMGSQSH